MCNRKECRICNKEQRVVFPDTLTNEEILKIEEHWERMRQFAPARHSVAPFESLIMRHASGIVGELRRVRKGRENSPEFIQNKGF